MSSATLYDYWRSSASYRVRIALNLAGISYRSIPIDLANGEQRSADHLARNPQGFVPLLEIDGMQLTQSLAILEYLDETRALGLLPGEPGQRARVQALAYALAVDVHPVCNLSVARHATSGLDDPETGMKDWMHRFIGPGLIAFNALLSRFEPASFCVGEKPGLADLCLIPQLYNARRWGIDLGNLPRLVAIDARCAEHPAFAAAHPDACRS